MRKRCTMDDQLWTRPFAASYLGVSVSIVSKLMMEGLLPYCFPYPGNDMDVRLYRDDVIQYRNELREQATQRMSAQQMRAENLRKNQQLMMSRLGRHR